MGETDTLKKWINESNYIVFFGGAGVSTESNIPDFRSTDGLYNQEYAYPPETILSHSFYKKKPEEFFRFYRNKMLFPNAQPNAAHKALARLEQQGKLKAVITQNIDGLHQKAGSREVLELHGSVLRNYCEHCGRFYSLEDLMEKKELVPKCSCGGIIKPDVVLYEEGLDQQVLSAAVFFIPFALFSRYSYRITWRDAGNILIVTLLIVYGWMYMLLWGASYTTPIDASVIATLGPAFTLIMDHLMHPRKYIGTRVVGVVCALVGAGILILGDGFSLTHGSRAQGNLFVLAAVVAIAVNTVIIKPQLEKLGTLVVMGWYYIVGLAVTAPFFWKYIDHTQFLRLPLQAQAELAYILILGTVLPMYLLYRGTEKLTSVHTALYRYIQPVIAGILALVRGQAVFDAANIVALAFIFAGVVLVVIGYKYYVRHGLPPVGHDGRLRT